MNNKDLTIYWKIEKLVFTPSKMQATANKVDGDTSLALALIADRRFSAVSLRPERTSQNLSVSAVHRTIT